MNKLPLRPNVCMILVSKDAKIFLGERSHEPGHWQFPQGGAEVAWSLEENALRELHEELGVPISSLRVIKQLDGLHEYEWSTPPVSAFGKWRGQSQRFFLVKFIGDDSEIDLSHEDELADWRWCSIEEVREHADPRRLKGYEKVIPQVESYLEMLLKDEAR